MTRQQGKGGGMFFRKSIQLTGSMYVGRPWWFLIRVKVLDDLDSFCLWLK
jgi:hypothetical protein